MEATNVDYERQDKMYDYLEGMNKLKVAWLIVRALMNKKIKIMPTILDFKQGELEVGITIPIDIEKKFKRRTEENYKVVM